MIIASRPLRFLALTLGGWTAVRVAWLWPAIDSVPAALRAVAPIPPALADVASLPRRTYAPLVIAIPPRHDRRETAAPPLPTAPRAMRWAMASSPAAREPVSLGVAMAVGPAVTPYVGAPLSAAERGVPSAARLSASSWLIARAGGRALPFAGQLGGSQAGLRLTYALDFSRRIALAARFSSALGSRQREAALGLDWQPTRLPVHLFAEQRIGLEQARGGPSVGLIAGLPPTALAGGFRLEGYGQAGGIARGGIEGFADGALRMARPIASVGGTQLDLGAGAWGGAQRNAARLDVGPSLGLTLPVPGRPVRLSLDWRQRIAGRAAPGSGPALSLGSDF